MIVIGKNRQKNGIEKRYKCFLFIYLHIYIFIYLHIYIFIYLYIYIFIQFFLPHCIHNVARELNMITNMNIQKDENVDLTMKLNLVGTMKPKDVHNPNIPKGGPNEMQSMVHENGIPSIPIVDFDDDCVNYLHTYPGPSPRPCPDNYTRQMIENMERTIREKSLTDYMQIPKSIKLFTRQKRGAARETEVTNLHLSSPRNAHGPQRPYSAMTDCDSPGRASFMSDETHKKKTSSVRACELENRRPSTYSPPTHTLLPVAEGHRYQEEAAKRTLSGLRTASQTQSDGDAPVLRERQDEIKKGVPLSRAVCLSDGLDDSSSAGSLDGWDSVKMREGVKERARRKSDSHLRIGHSHSFRRNVTRNIPSAAEILSLPLSLPVSPSYNRVKVLDRQMMLSSDVLTSGDIICHTHASLPWSGHADRSSLLSSSPSASASPSSFRAPNIRKHINNDINNICAHDNTNSNTICTKNTVEKSQATVALSDTTKMKIDPLRWKKWNDEQILRKLGLYRYNCRAQEISNNQIHRGDIKNQSRREKENGNETSSYLVSGLNSYSQEARKQSVLRTDFESFVNNKFNGTMYKNGFKRKSAVDS